MVDEAKFCIIPQSKFVIHDPYKKHPENIFTIMIIHTIVNCLYFPPEFWALLIILWTPNVHQALTDQIKDFVILEEMHITCRLFVLSLG